MAFLRVDGWTLDALVEDFSLDDVSVEKYDRTVNDGLEGLTYNYKRQVTLTTPPLALADALAVEGWVRNRKHAWNFTRPSGGTVVFTPYSSDSGQLLPNLTGVVSGLYTASWAARLVSGATSTATVSFGSEGDWTIHFYHRPSTASFSSYVVRSRNGVIDAWADNASTATVRMVGYSVASGFLGVRLLGRNSAGSNATSDYASVSIARFAYNDSQIVSLSSALFGQIPTGQIKAPYVNVTGDALQTSLVVQNGVGETGLMRSKGFVESFDVEKVVIGGVFRYNARRLRIRLLEK